MIRPTRSIGQDWEDFAARRVAAAGLRILARGYHCRLGEIDLIATDDDTLVFIEVRYRTASSFADAATSVTCCKQQRILKAARHFLMRHPQYSEHPIRMDVIALAATSAAPSHTRMQWIRDAFDASV